MQRNVLGGELVPCSLDPLTGFYRTGCCENHGDDPGFHVVCCRVTAEFLAFSAEHGNDLSTPMLTPGPRRSPMLAPRGRRRAARHRLPVPPVTALPPARSLYAWRHADEGERA